MPLLLLLAILLLACGSTAGESTSPDQAWTKLRHECLNRPRRIIFNNDGNEPVVFCKTATADELLRLRTAPLAGSQVDSIFYCTWSSGFGLFTHNTKVGQVFSTREAMFSKNLTEEFLDKRLDPLQIMAKFAHQHGIELFWSMRMNDTHDGASAIYAPVMFRANKLKQQHPEWLIGSKERRPKYGAWSAVDYAVPEIRDLAFRYCEEVCQNYDVDGLELDFFRHAFFFKCSGAGEPCGETDLNQMTALIRRIRDMTEALGRKRNRPILLAIRVPDSVEYCKYIGLDLQHWLAEGLVDLLIAGGYTQLNPWEYSVALGHKYGVKVYPSLDEPRVRNEAARKLRETPETYRGRALNVWQAGADGVYLFNFFNPVSPLWHELGDPAILHTLDRNYFASVRGVGSMPVPHEKFIHVPTLNPASPILIAPENPGRIEFSVGEDFVKTNRNPRITLHLQFKNPDARLTTVLNGTDLANGNLREGWLEFPLNRKMLRNGVNALNLNRAPVEKKALSLLDLYVSVTEN